MYNPIFDSWVRLKLWKLLYNKASRVFELGINGGGDTPESLVDALECTGNMKYRAGVDRYIIVITDANYKEGSTSSYFANMFDEIKNLKQKDISVSIVTESRYYTTYQTLTSDTNGILANINENFSLAFLPIVQKNGVLTNSGNWYHKSVLLEFFRDGVRNPDFNEYAAKITHIGITIGE